MSVKLCTRKYPPEKSKFEIINFQNKMMVFLTETISRTDMGEPRLKYIFKKNVELTSTFFTLQRFGPSPSPNFKCILHSWQDKSVYHRHAAETLNCIYVTLKSSSVI